MSLFKNEIFLCPCCNEFFSYLNFQVHLFQKLSTTNMSLKSYEPCEDSEDISPEPSKNTSASACPEESEFPGYQYITISAHQKMVRGKSMFIRETRRLVKKKAENYYCHICKLSLYRHKFTHERSKTHQRSVKMLSMLPKNASETSTPVSDQSPFFVHTPSHQPETSALIPESPKNASISEISTSPQPETSGFIPKISCDGLLPENQEISAQPETFFGFIPKSPKKSSEGHAPSPQPETSGFSESAEKYTCNFCKNAFNTINDLYDHSCNFPIICFSK